MCGGLIDFRKALEWQGKFSVTINVAAKDVNDALKKAYIEIRRTFGNKGNSSVVVEKADRTK